MFELSLKLLLTAALAAALIGCDGEPFVPDEPFAVELTAPADTLLLGATYDFVATVRDRHGKPMAGRVVWTSSDTTVATVDAAGRVHARAVGPVIVTARAGAVSGTAAVPVPVPGSLRGQHQLYAAGDRPLPAVVFDEIIPDQGRLVITAQSGQVSIDRHGAYEQRVIHSGTLDGVPIAVLNPIDRGRCRIATGSMRCDSEIIVNQWFEAAWAGGEIDTRQDFVREDGVSQAVVYSFAQVAAM